MSRSLPSRGFVGIALTVMAISLFAILFMADLIVDEFDPRRQMEIFFVVAFPVCVGAITSLAALMIATYTMRESSDSEKGTLALSHVESFEDLIRKSLNSTDPMIRAVYLKEANSFLDSVFAIHDTIRCFHQRKSVERRLYSVFPVVALEGFPLRAISGLTSLTGKLNEVKKGALESFVKAKEISS